MRRDSKGELIGQSSSMAALRAEIARVAPTSAKVLITGESGVGKELVARAIHAGSRRPPQSYVVMNCAGLPDTLLESELFGHVKGSFTGAYRDKPGRLEMAESGTVFLDEVGEMSLRMQGLLLRFLETGEVQKVGSERTFSVANVRIIAATNRDLRKRIAEDRFREDLFYRLNVIHMQVPPLRERREDVPALLEFFLERARMRWSLSMRQGVGAGVSAQALGGEGVGVDAAALEMLSLGPLRLSGDAAVALTMYSWPGNVRELENVVERLVVQVMDDEVQIEDLPPEIAATSMTPARPRGERRRSVVDGLYKRLRQDGESFFTVVYPMYMHRDITREHVRELVRKGLEEARGNYRIVAKLFNLPSEDYRKFLSFLRKHDCQLPFQDYRR